MSLRRPAFRRMLEDALRPASDVGALVVHHTSRFTRDVIEARVVKAKLRRLGVRVLSVCLLAHVADVVCFAERVTLLHVVERIDIDETRIVVTRRSTGRGTLGGRNDATLVGAMST
jgi:Resolvase, N terminal domain